MTVYDLTIGGQTKRSTTGQHPASIDWEKLPEASRDFVIRYGLKQYLADGMAGAENVADAATGVAARVAKLLSGDLTRTRGEAKEATDTVGGRATKLVKAAIRTTMKAKDVKASKEAVAEAAKKLLADEAKAKPWLAKAQKQLDDEAKMADDLDIGDLIAAAAGAGGDDEEAEPTE